VQKSSLSSNQEDISILSEPSKSNYYEYPFLISTAARFGIGKRALCEIGSGLLTDLGILIFSLIKTDCAPLKFYDNSENMEFGYQITQSMPAVSYVLCLMDAKISLFLALVETWLKKNT
jgi:hypothetical protein